MNDKILRQMMVAAMKKARLARAVVMGMRVVGDKEGKGGTGHGVGNEGGMQQRGQWHVVGCLYSIQYKSIFGMPDKVRCDMCDKARPLSQV